RPVGALEELRAIRLRLTGEALASRPIRLCIEETGDRTKGQTTAYVAAQCLGSLHQSVERGMVLVNAAGVLDKGPLPPGVCPLEAHTLPQAGGRLLDPAATGPRADRAPAGARLPVRWGAGRDGLGRE